MDFFGIRLGAGGITMQSKKHDALLNASAPTTPAELRSLLGLASYCSRFIADFATVVAPLRELTKKNVKWQWGKVEEKALNELKARIVTNSTAYFDKSLRTELAVDASPVGLAVVMSQC
jgi:hypothetical protein